MERVRQGPQALPPGAGPTLETAASPARFIRRNSEHGFLQAEEVECSQSRRPGYRGGMCDSP